MTFRTQTLTILPALCLFLLSTYFAFSVFQVADLSVKRGLVVMALCYFVGGLALSLSWIFHWGISKRIQESESGITSRFFSLERLIGFSLIAVGSATLTWVIQLTLHDINTWGKGVPLIFFGSRTGETISLGIGLKVIHYLLIGSALIVLGLVTFLRKRFRKCPYHFGYLQSHPQRTPLPRKCLSCSKVRDCISSQSQKEKMSVKSAEKKE